jgi:signal transduction histidine kinase
MREILSEIAASTAHSIGTEFLAALVKSMREAMEAKLVFITTGLGEPPRRARSLASWQQGGPLDAFEYDLEGTPCRLVYEGETMVISQGLYRQFEKEPGYEGYIGVPLRNGAGKVIGHFAVLSAKPLALPEEGVAIVKLFALRAQAELQRLDHEREREALIVSLARTNRRLANRHNALRESADSRSILLGMVAHDLRNPLSAILSRSELIQALLDKEDVRSDRLAKARESCGMIVATAERMDRLIASALTQARAEAVAITLDTQDFSVGRAIDMAIALNAAAAARKSISLRHDGAEDVAVRGDEDRIVEALDNLIRNAIKYSHAGQGVTAGARAMPGSIDISVRDEGQGLTVEDCARAFRQFQRLSAKPTAGESSTGLGLAIVKTIAEAHGGSAIVVSEGKGKGATFTLSLPRSLV